MNEELKAHAVDLVALLKQGAQISRDRNLNLDYAKVADQAATEIDRLTREAVAADIRIANDAAVIAGLTAETVRLANKAEAQDRVIQTGREAVVKIATERDALQAKLAALKKQEPVGVVDSGLPGEIGWTEQGKSLEDGQELYAAAGAAPVPEGWRSAVAMAYGHLWHVNNEPMAPIPLRSEESASYAARKLLRDLMTTKERGEAINAVQKLLAAAPKEQP